MNKNIFNNHPLIQNSNQYFLQKKFVSINSEDRDVTKFPNSSEFEISLPQDYLNVASARLYSWSFPANYNVFSTTMFNLVMTFRFDKLYNPGEHQVNDTLNEGIFAALYHHGENNIRFEIEPGFYNPDQMAIELTNKFNDAVTRLIFDFFESPAGAAYSAAASLFLRYDRFAVVYNTITQKLWFGNSADKFTLTNDSQLILERTIVNNNCLRKNMLPEFENWGLPAYLGFTRCNASAQNVIEYLDSFPGDVAVSKKNGTLVPRFYYGDAVAGTGDNGYWLLPVLPGATVYFLQAPLKIAFMGPAYIFMEIEGMNCIDETAPYNFNFYTATHSNSNGIVNSAFAKFPVPTTPLSQWFDNDMGPYMFWNPPAERISKLKIKFRYHNGMLVEFGNFSFSFMIEFNLLVPQQQRSYSIVDAYDLAQNQPFSNKFI
jgi:hypothetical protein